MTRSFLRELILIVGVILLLVQGVGCTKTEEPTKDDTYQPINGEGTATITFDPNGGNDLAPRVYYIDEVPNDYPTPYYEDHLFLGWAIERDTTYYYDFTTPIEKDITLYATWKDLRVDYSYYLDEYIPDIIYENLNLPTEDDDLILMWTSDNTSLFNTSGEVNRPRNDAEINVILKVYDHGVLTEYQKKVTIAAIEMPDLPSENLVVGYYSSWNFFGMNEDIMSTCDVINICFGYVNTDFTVNASEVNAMLIKLNQCHAAGVRVLLSIQGYSSGGVNFSNAAKTAKSRQTFANSCLEFIEKYNLDGIDIDWEYPGYNTGTTTAVDKANYTLLCQTLSETLKARNSDYLVTAAIPGGPYTTPRFDLKNVSNYLDYINIMTYDLNSGSTATHHTALYSSSGTASKCTVYDSVNIYIQAGVPASKLAIGMAFYGKYSDATKLGGSCSFTKTIPYTKILSNYLSRLGKGVAYYFDEAAQAPYLIDSENGYFITYDDERSIKAKCEYAKTKNLRGIMIWEVGEDESSTLINAVKANMKN